MPLAIPTNCTFDVYRGYAPATPCNPPNPVAVTGARGVLREHVRNGRFGFVPATAQPMHWTTVLLCDASVDVRDGWNAELNTFVETNADTVLVHDSPIAGVNTPFCVVQVQLKGRKIGKYLRVYMDRRAQPCYGVSSPCCPNVSIPTTLHATFTNGTGTCSCLNGLTVTLTHSGSTWGGSFAGCGNPRSDVVFFCLAGQWVFQFANPNLHACQSNVTALAGTCTPFAFSGVVTILAVTPCCMGSITVTVTP